jgi:hypothetical protein
MTHLEALKTRSKEGKSSDLFYQIVGKQKAVST